MKIKCEFCGSMINDTESVCPSCGAPNKNVRRSSGDQPLTIQELRQWYESKGLPPESVTRFFIGKDIREPRAFGIYFDENTGNWVLKSGQIIPHPFCGWQPTKRSLPVCPWPLARVTRKVAL